MWTHQSKFERALRWLSNNTVTAILYDEQSGLGLIVRRAAPIGGGFLSEQFKITGDDILSFRNEAYLVTEGQTGEFQVKSYFEDRKKHLPNPFGGSRAKTAGNA